MKNLMILGCFILCQFSCAQKYFEGKVTFNKTYEPIDTRLTAELLAEYYGNWMIGMVQENRYLMYAPLNSKDTMKIYYFLESSDGYIENSNSDTIEHFRIDEELAVLKNVKSVNSKKMVLGELCSAVSIEYKPNIDYIEKVIGVYYFNPKYKLNKELYIHHKDNFWNLFVAKSGSISVRNEITYFPIYKAIYQASNIEEQKIDDRLFILNPNKFIKEKD